MTDMTRWLDDQPPPLGEAVIAALDAVREYKRSLIDHFEVDAANAERGWHGAPDRSAFNAAVEAADHMIHELEGWSFGLEL